MISQETLHKMPLNEKLLMMETLWDDISTLGEQLPVPQWHADLLDEREKEVTSGKAVFLDWEDAKRQILESIK